MLQNLQTEFRRSVHDAHGQLHRARALGERARIVLAMSGTFAPNYNSELYPHLRALAPETILGASGKPMTSIDFEQRYTFLKPFGPKLSAKEMRRVI